MVIFAQYLFQRFWGHEKFVFRPVQRIVLDIFSVAFKVGVISDDVFEKSALPTKIREPIFSCPFGYVAFALVDDDGKGSRDRGTKEIESGFRMFFHVLITRKAKDPMKVVGHCDVLVQSHVCKSSGYFLPSLLKKAAKLIQMHLLIFNFSKKVQALAGTNRNRKSPESVIVILESCSFPLLIHLVLIA